MEPDSTKSRNHYRIPGKLWKLLKKHLPKAPTVSGPSRPRVNNQEAIDGIWYVLWTGCQWKSIRKEWFHVSSSVLYERFQTWQHQALFERWFKTILKHYARECGIHWKSQSVDRMTLKARRALSAAPLGGDQTGRTPTDRGQSGSKIHLLVDQAVRPCLFGLPQPTNTINGLPMI